MSLSDLLQELEPQTAAALRQLQEDLERRLEATGRELLDHQLSAEPRADEPAPAAPELLDPVEELKHAIVAIDRSASQAEILTAMLEGARRFASRAAVFLNRGEALSLWGSQGFDDATGDLSGFELRADVDSPWRGAADADGCIALSSADSERFCGEIGVRTPHSAVLLPFVLGDLVAATVYCDRLEGEAPLHLSGLQLLCFAAGTVLETLPVRRRTATATLVLAPGPVDAPAAAEPLAVEAPPAEAPPAEAPPAEETAAAPAAETFGLPPEELRLTAPEIEEVQAPAEPAVATAPPAAPSFEAPAPAATPAPPPAPPDAGVDAGSGSTLVSPPEDLDGPGWAFTTTRIAPDAGDDSQHEEARRLARLLVTEIKLYNEEAVEEGRRQGNVYARLKEDIDRSRQIFDDRIDDGVRQEKDYFREALVRILAGGDPTVLGI